jgi:hypothetical protein
VSRLAAVPDLDAELDRLFELPPAEFTAARNDLVERLKRAGQAEPASLVKRLRKPTIAVWTINQLTRRHAKDVDALLAAGEELRGAQESALAGGMSDRLRAATAAEREALRTLMRHAQALLATAGQRPMSAVLERIASTLRAAALGPRGREVLGAGRLSEELESTGFGGFEGMRVPARPKEGPQRTRRTGVAEQRRREERRNKLFERAKTLEQKAAAAQRAASKAETAANRARREAERATAAAERARAELLSFDQ